jgi:hypothetical protein
MMQGHEGLHDLGVELGSAAALDLGNGVLDRERRLVGASVGHRVERVGYGDDPSRDRDRGSE